jgi:uncharacterized membrane protein YfcA
MLAAFGGARLGAMLPDAILIIAFSVVMIGAGGAMLVRSRRPMRPPAESLDVSRVLAIGVFVGLLTGTLGTGGGFLIVPALTIAGGLAMRAAVGTSLLVISLNALAGIAGASSYAAIDPALVAAVTAIAVVGSLIGVRLSGRLSAQHLQAAFGCFVIVVGLAILARELV